MDGQSSERKRVKTMHERNRERDDRMAEKDTRRGSTSKEKVVGVWFV